MQLGAGDDHPEFRRQEKVTLNARQKRFELSVDDDSRILIKRWLGDAHLTLASGSPRRKHILGLAGLDFDVVVPQVQESGTANLEPRKYALAQAVCKLQSVTVETGVVVAADTIVVCDDHILGKPSDREDARRILGLLSGRQHFVYTALALRNQESSRIAADVQASRVLFRKLTESEIEDYIDSGEPMDKAGAYGIQGMGELLVDRLDGSLSNVIGFPVSLFIKLLRELADGV